MSDSQIWQNLKQGKPEALEQIYKAHFAFLYNYGRKISDDAATVEDCIQELFVELWNNRSTIGDTDNIRPYLTVSYRRKLIKTINKLSKSNNDQQPEEQHFAAELAIDELWIKSESDKTLSAKLKKAFGQLSSRQQEVIYLKYYSGMDGKSIAASMNINHQSVRNLLSKAILMLSKQLHLLVIIFLSKL